VEVSTGKSVDLEAVPFIEEFRKAAKALDQTLLRCLEIMKVPSEPDSLSDGQKRALKISFENVTYNIEEKDSPNTSRNLLVHLQSGPSANEFKLTTYEGGFLNVVFRIGPEQVQGWQDMRPELRGGIHDPANTMAATELMLLHSITLSDWLDRQSQSG